MAVLHWKQGLLCDKPVSPFVHIFDTISLFAVESEEPKIGISCERFYVFQMIEGVCLIWRRKNVGKRENGGYKVSSKFSNARHHKIVKSRHCVVKG